MDMTARSVGDIIGLRRYHRPIYRNITGLCWHYTAMQIYHRPRRYDITGLSGCDRPMLRYYRPMRIYDRLMQISQAYGDITGLRIYIIGLMGYCRPVQR